MSHVRGRHEVCQLGHTSLDEPGHLELTWKAVRAFPRETGQRGEREDMETISLAKELPLKSHTLPRSVPQPAMVRRWQRAVLFRWSIPKNPSVSEPNFSYGLQTSMHVKSLWWSFESIWGHLGVLILIHTVRQNRSQNSSLRAKERLCGVGEQPVTECPAHPPALARPPWSPFLSWGPHFSICKVITRARGAVSKTVVVFSE